jgi:hypothetical protein
VGDGDRGEGVGGGGGTAFNLAELACPRRSTTPSPGRTASHDKVEQLVELLLAEVLQTRSLALTRTDDKISEPETLRRVDGSSVYTVAGSELFTSARILAAEQRLVAVAGRTDGQVVDGTLSSWRCWNQPATGSAWTPDRWLWFVHVHVRCAGRNAGQAHLVHPSR